MTAPKPPDLGAFAELDDMSKLELERLITLVRLAAADPDTLVEAAQAELDYRRQLARGWRVDPAVREEDAS